jgi:hypothetical protein
LKSLLSTVASIPGVFDDVILDNIDSGMNFPGNFHHHDVFKLKIYFDHRVVPESDLPHFFCSFAASFGHAASQKIHICGSAESEKICHYVCIFCRGYAMFAALH